MKTIKSIMMAAALPLAFSMAAPVMAENTGSTTASVNVPQQYAARPAKRAVRRRAAVAKTPVAAAHHMKKDRKWVYTAKRMRPPKGKKWQGRWNDMGRDGWELVAMSENMYIFKRPSDFPLMAEAGTIGWSNDVTSAVKTEAVKETKKAAKKSVKKVKYLCLEFLYMRPGNRAFVFLERSA